MFSAGQFRISSQEDSLGKKVDSLDSGKLTDYIAEKENQAGRPSLVDMVKAKANMILANTLASAPGSNDYPMNITYGAESELTANYETGSLVNQLL